MAILHFQEYLLHGNKDKVTCTKPAKALSGVDSKAAETRLR